MAYYGNAKIVQQANIIFKMSLLSDSECSKFESNCWSYIYIKEQISCGCLRHVWLILYLYPHSFSHTFNPHSWTSLFLFKHLLFSTKPSHPLQVHLLALSHIEEQISCGCLCHVWLIQLPPPPPFWGGGRRGFSLVSPLLFSTVLNLAPKTFCWQESLWNNIQAVTKPCWISDEARLCALSLSVCTNQPKVCVTPCRPWDQYRQPTHCWKLR